jgi:hypothetical protein
MGGAAGMGDAGSGGAAGGSACVALGDDCSSGICCKGLECMSDADGNVFSCGVPLL